MAVTIERRRLRQRLARHNPRAPAWNTLMIRLSAFADEISPDPSEQLDVLSEHEIRHIEFRSILGTNVLDLTDEQHQDFRALLRSRGFGLSAIGSPIGKIQITDPFEPHLLRFERALALADLYGTPRIRIFSYYLPKGEDPGKYRGEVMQRMVAKARIAESRGVTLLLENERYIYGDTAARVLDVLETAGSARLGHAFDPANYVEVGQPIDEAWRMLRARTIHFHVKDYDPALKKNVPTGSGSGQIPELIADAVAHGYDGFCVLEPHLLVSELTHGFTGPERFGDAARALKTALDQRGIAYQ
jgi:sugar phosphate isomerase/epimerase